MIAVDTGFLYALANASLVLLAGHMGDGRILSADERDFGAYRWKRRKPFRNLLAA